MANPAHAAMASNPPPTEAPIAILLPVDNPELMGDAVLTGFVAVGLVAAVELMAELVDETSSTAVGTEAVTAIFTEVGI